MEENKTVDINSNEKESTKRPEKLSYEQLEALAKQLSEQNQQLVTRMRQMDSTNMFTQLSYLFEVVKAESVFAKYGHDTFVDKVLTEIISMMTPPQEEENVEKN